MPLVLSKRNFVLLEQRQPVVQHSSVRQHWLPWVGMPKSLSHHQLLRPRPNFQSEKMERQNGFVRPLNRLPYLTRLSVRRPVHSQPGETGQRQRHEVSMACSAVDTTTKAEETGLQLVTTMPDRCSTRLPGDNRQSTKPFLPELLMSEVLKRFAAYFPLVPAKPLRLGPCRPHEQQ